MPSFLKTFWKYCDSLDWFILIKFFTFLWILEGCDHFFTFSHFHIFHIFHIHLPFLHFFIFQLVSMACTGFNCLGQITLLAAFPACWAMPNVPQACLLHIAAAFLHFQSFSLIASVCFSFSWVLLIFPAFPHFQHPPNCLMLLTFAGRLPRLLCYNQYSLLLLASRCISAHSGNYSTSLQECVTFLMFIWNVYIAMDVLNSAVSWDCLVSFNHHWWHLINFDVALCSLYRYECIHLSCCSKLIHLLWFAKTSTPPVGGGGVHHLRML